MKYKGELIFVAILTLILVMFLVMALDYEPEARLVPLVVLVPALAIAAIELVANVYSLNKIENTDSQPKRECALERIFNKENVMLGWIICLLAVVWFFGLSIASLLFTLVFVKIHYKEKWSTTVFSSLLCFAITYGIFVKGLKMALYKGFFISLFK